MSEEQKREPVAEGEWVEGLAQQVEMEVEESKDPQGDWMQMEEQLDKGDPELANGLPLDWVDKRLNSWLGGRESKAISAEVRIKNETRTQNYRRSLHEARVRREHQYGSLHPLVISTLLRSENIEDLREALNRWQQVPATIFQGQEAHMRYLMEELLAAQKMLQRIDTFSQSVPVSTIQRLEEQLLSQARDFNANNAAAISSILKEQFEHLLRLDFHEQKEICEWILKGREQHYQQGSRHHHLLTASLLDIHALYQRSSQRHLAMLERQLIPEQLEAESRQLIQEQLWLLNRILMLHQSVSERDYATVVKILREMACLSEKLGWGTTQSKYLEEALQICNEHLPGELELAATLKNELSKIAESSQAESLAVGLGSKRKREQEQGPRKEPRLEATSLIEEKQQSVAVKESLQLSTQLLAALQSHSPDLTAALQTNSQQTEQQLGRLMSRLFSECIIQASNIHNHASLVVTITGLTLQGYDPSGIGMILPESEQPNLSPDTFFTMGKILSQITLLKTDPSISNIFTRLKERIMQDPERFCSEFMSNSSGMTLTLVDNAEGDPAFQRAIESSMRESAPAATGAAAEIANNDAAALDHPLASISDQTLPAREGTQNASEEEAETEAELQRAIALSLGEEMPAAASALPETAFAQPLPPPLSLALSSVSLQPSLPSAATQSKSIFEEMVEILNSMMSDLFGRLTLGDSAARANSLISTISILLENPDDVALVDVLFQSAQPIPGSSRIFEQACGVIRGFLLSSARSDFLSAFEHVCERLLADPESFCREFGKSLSTRSVQETRLAPLSRSGLQHHSFHAVGASLPNPVENLIRQLEAKLECLVLEVFQCIGSAASDRQEECFDLVLSVVPMLFSGEEMNMKEVVSLCDFTESNHSEIFYKLEQAFSKIYQFGQAKDRPGEENPQALEMFERVRNGLEQRRQALIAEYLSPGVQQSALAAGF